MDATQLLDALRQSTFASAFSPDLTRSLADGASWKRFPAGAVLFREGQPSDAFYVVHQGHVALDMTLPARGPTRLLTVGPGEIIAWSALVGNGRMTTSATAIDEVELIELSGAALLQRCETEPQLGYRLMRQLAAALAKRLLATRLQMLDLFFADRTDDGSVL
jgi:CRP-like cAMP-binding protein